MAMTNLAKPRLAFRNAFVQANRRRQSELGLLAAGSVALVGLPSILLLLGGSPLVFGLQQMLAFVAYLLGRDSAECLRRYAAALRDHAPVPVPARRALARRLTILAAALFVVAATSLLLSAWQATQAQHRAAPQSSPNVATPAPKAEPAAAETVSVNVTQAQLDRIRIGQSMSDVLTILPRAGVLQSRNLYANVGLVEVYQWAGLNRSSVNIEFHNNKVSDIRIVYPLN
jgi:hypothetical protein